MEPTNLSKMLNNLRLFQLHVHGTDHSTLSDTGRMTFLRNYVLALHVEQVEMLQELPWKPWGYASNDMANIDRQKVLKEFVDCLVFLLDQALCLEFSAEEICETFYDILSSKSKIQTVKKG